MTDKDIRSAITGCLTVASDGVLINLWVQPRASKNEVIGLHGSSIKVKVTAPATEGRANEAVLDLLASTLGVKRSQLTLVGGNKSRDKRVILQGLVPEDILDRLTLYLRDRRQRQGG